MAFRDFFFLRLTLFSRANPSVVVRLEDGSNVRGAIAGKLCSYADRGY